jgi:hypothetical protein
VGFIGHTHTKKIKNKKYIKNKLKNLVKFWLPSVIWPSLLAFPNLSLLFCPFLSLIFVFALP